MRTSRFAVGALGALATFAIAASVTAAAESTRPDNGPIQVFLTPKGGGNSGGKILITGAIGDHGTYGPNVNAEGKPEPKGTFGRIVLTQGTIEVNLKALSAKAKQAKPTVNKVTCSISVSAKGPVSFVSGTGLYAGISGVVNLTELYGGVAPRYSHGAHKGKCDFKGSAKGVVEDGVLYGSGNVKFSAPAGVIYARD